LVRRRLAAQPARRKPQQRRARDTVEAVLDAVVRLLKRDGVAAVTTNRIAEVAGVSIGSVYQYFPDKRAIYLALHDRHAEQVQRALLACVAEHEGAALEQLVPALVDTLADAHAGDPELYQLLLSEVPHGADSTRELEQRLRAALRPSVLAAAPDQSPRELERTLFMLTQLLDGLAHAAVLRRPPQLSLAAAKTEAVRAILAYLRS